MRQNEGPPSLPSLSLSLSGGGAVFFPVAVVAVCPNTFTLSHQRSLNACWCRETKGCLASQYAPPTRQPIPRKPVRRGWGGGECWGRGAPTAPRNSQTYFSNLWTDNKSTLRPGQRVIHQREMAANWATMRREQDEAHICTEVTQRARVRACTASQFVPSLCCQTAKFQPPSRQTRKHFYFF